MIATSSNEQDPHSLLQSDNISESVNKYPLHQNPMTKKSSEKYTPIL